ncbi:MAG: hypothetical protein K2Q01_06090 [Rickettsiales bacterium]|nr:hypothetical protein [Rickettsiales bacterium]
MLDVIADFWKPVKKAPQAETLKPELLQVGSSMGFGFVPQAMLSGRRLHITAINTYLFGDESLTSFVLSQDKDPSVSMIVAESDGEYYLAISRRISLNDRAKLFDEQELDNVMSRQDTTRLTARDHIIDYKGWVVSSYKREIQGLKGTIFKGDFRKGMLPQAKDGHEFEYTLLVSDSNEHAIEIEKYSDGRVEVYATVYRRMNDIGEISHPAPTETARPEMKLASGTDTASPIFAGPRFVEAGNEDKAPEPKEPEIKEPGPKYPEMKEPQQEPKENVAEHVKSEPLELQELSPPPPVIPVSYTDPAASAAGEQINPGVFTLNKSVSAAEEKQPEAKVEKPYAPATYEPTPSNITNETRNAMSTAEALKPKLYVTPTGPEAEGKAPARTGMENEAIECDLRVANKIIDEAIRNEMRLTDIVRRIIELPVAYPESVQIPMSLTDADYSLLAIRYGISASDRNAIKRRIIEDLNDFSGKK